MQTVAEITFRVSDYQYVGATSADEALEKARVQKPALILADEGIEITVCDYPPPSLCGIPHFAPPDQHH